jgi:hypothetical protein
VKTPGGCPLLPGDIRHRRADTIGVLVLAGIAVGTVLGLLSGDPRLVLVEGSVPTAVFGLLCLGSLWARRPLIYRFAIEFIGADTPKGREFESLWQYHGFRHAFRLYTVVWGIAYLAEAAARIIIVETTSTGTALTVSKVMPYVVGAAIIAWMIAHGRHARREGERLAAEARAEARPEAQAAGNAPEPVARLGVVGPVVLGQHVVAEIVRRVPPRRMDVGAVSLRVVVLDEQGRALHPVVVPVAG